VRLCFVTEMDSVTAVRDTHRQSTSKDHSSVAGCQGEAMPSGAVYHGSPRAAMETHP